MDPDRIEREILIEAPVGIVWSAVTEPEQIVRWYCDTADIDLRRGGEGTLTWNLRATNKPATVPIVIESVEPPHTFAYRWLHPAGAEARKGNSLLVEFTLMAEGDNTRVRFVERGLLEMDWSDEAKTKYFDEHRNGWWVHLTSLRDYVSRQAHASAPH